MRVTIEFCGLEVDVEYESQPDYISPRATEDCEQGFENFEVVEARYADVLEFVEEFYEYWSKPDLLQERWLPECPVAGNVVHDKVYDWLAKYEDAIRDNVREEVAS